MNNTTPRFKTVMLIDDNPIDLYVAGKLIEKNEVCEQLVEFNSAEKALAHLSAIDDPDGWPEVLLVDIYMPGMSGFEFMQAYDTFPDDVKSHCQVYIVSSSMDESDIRRANDDQNVAAFQEKPITSQFLQNLPPMLH